MNTAQMHNKAEEPVRSKMESLCLICETQIPINQQKTDTFAASFRHSLESVKAKAQDTIQNQAKLAKLKADPRDAEDEFVKLLAVKTRREAKQMETRDSIAAKKARVEELKRTVEVQRARRDKNADIISQQSMELDNSNPIPLIIRIFKTYFMDLLEAYKKALKILKEAKEAERSALSQNRKYHAKRD